MGNLILIKEKKILMIIKIRIHNAMIISIIAILNSETTIMIMAMEIFKYKRCESSNYVNIERERKQDEKLPPNLSFVCVLQTKQMKGKCNIGSFNQDLNNIFRQTTKRVGNKQRLLWNCTKVHENMLKYWQTPKYKMSYIGLFL